MIHKDAHADRDEDKQQGPRSPKHNTRCTLHHMVGLFDSAQVGHSKTYLMGLGEDGDVRKRELERSDALLLGDQACRRGRGMSEEGGTAEVLVIKRGEASRAGGMEMDVWTTTIKVMPQRYFRELLSTLPPLEEELSISMECNITGSGATWQR